MKMTITQAFAYIEASRVQYNLNCPDDQLDFEGAYDMIVECSPSVGTDRDDACLKAIHRAVDKARARAEEKLFRKCQDTIDPELVGKYLVEGFE